MATFYPRYPHKYSYPIKINKWNPVIPVQSSLYSVPTPVVLNPTRMFTTQICPCVAPVVPVLPSPIITQVGSNDGSSISNYTYGQSLSYSEHIEPLVDNDQTSYYMPENEIRAEVIKATTDIERSNKQGAQDTLEFYITLPKELFPSARMLTLDPNAIIDEFCKLANVQQHAPWILDLEFGIPKSPTTRPIPTYNVKFNSVHCKNTPQAIHPGFESCSQDFKRTLRFYYDCIISVWYRGYIIMNDDRSVENFQSWLLLPMQVLGMCWP